MKEIRFGEQLNNPVCLVLGFFDSVHFGHTKLINKATSYAKENNIESAILTFDNNPFSVLKKDIDLIYSYSERLIRFAEENLDYVISATFNESFMKTNKDDFLNIIFSSLNIKKIICGFDYTFGSYPMGDASYLKEYCKNNNVEIEVVNEVLYKDKKISSTLIRSLLKEGNIVEANICLDKPYRITGDVVHGHSIGSNLLGYPTANITVDKDKLLLKEGVYYTYVCINGIKYKAITNAGRRPTFDDDKLCIETHIIDFESDLYGKTITVFFLDYLRDVIHFENKDQLIDQLSKDKENVLKLKL